MRLPRRVASRRVSFSTAVVVAAIFAGALALLRALAPAFLAPRSPPRRRAADLGRAAVVQEPPAAVASPTSSASWILPTVDKDVGEWLHGRNANYAWVQTTSTLYLFTPAVESDDGPQVTLKVQNEGSMIVLTVGGVDILRGPLKHQVKPGEEIWMIEDAPDGRPFVVAEFEKLKPGTEWTSVMKPEVTFASGYDRPSISKRTISNEAQESFVAATLEHLRRKHAGKTAAPEGHKAIKGDLLTVDMQGFELTPDGGRGVALEEVPATEGQVFELGGEGSFPAQVHEQLVGINVGETRDVQVTLSRRAGNLGGQKILCAFTCREIKVQELPEISDEFAKQVKRAEQFAQAGTEAGIPENERGIVDTYTMDMLRAEIAAEVTQQADESESTGLQVQLQAALTAASEVRGDWADLSPEKLAAEELAETVAALLHKHDLESQIDAEKLRKATWDDLGTPKNGERVAEVGADPDREFQEAHRRLLRKWQFDVAMEWLGQRAEVLTPETA